ncbi:bifunctional DNA primase/polymerase [Nocardioides sp.]|uniref:bifunctional DNA primase/polymerase n=1 Tax=Nocardioides sp. TaxID=35761 RepID=UPI003D0C98DC
MNHSAQRQSRTSRWNPWLPVTLSDATDLATASMMLATRDIPVFPCTPGGKQPLTTHGFHDASTDPATVRGWWQRWPEANIGMPTGAAAGVDVVDVDVHSSGNGFAAFERARSAGIADGWAWLVRTPSAGVHAYYLRGGVDEQRSWQVPSQHVDFRGDGGYIIVPPSTVAGRAYELIAVAQHRATPVDASALRAFLEPPRPSRPPASMPAVGSRPEKLADWVAARPEGARNHGLFWAACRMVEEGHSFDSTANLLGDAARSAGLSDREAMTTIRSAYRIASRLGATTVARPTAAAEAVSL